MRVAASKISAGNSLRRRKLRTKVRLFLTVVIFLMAPLCIGLAHAQETDETIAPAVVTTEQIPVTTPQPAVAVPAPLVTPDTEIFRRTPIIDGVVEDGEWDSYYTFSTTDWTINTYSDWDSEYLYIAAKSNKPIDMLTLLDADANGWFHGEDNYEFRAIRTGDGAISLNVSRYDSQNAKMAAAAPVTLNEASSVDVRSTGSENNYAIEMRIPASMIRGFRLSEKKKIGLQVAVRETQDEGSWIPSTVMGNSRDCSECILVSKKIAALKPLEVGFDLRDNRIARGEELVCKLHLTDQGTETVDVRSFVIAGEGKSGDFLSSQKVRMEGLPPKKHISHEFRSIIPSNMPLGSWAIGAEIRSNDSRLGGALAGFDVVEPFEIELHLPKTDVRADVKDVTFGIAINNNRRGNIRGKAKITLPAGWELWKNADTRDFAISGRSITSVSFKAKPPLGAAGSVPVKVEVNVNGEIKTAEGSFNVVNPHQQGQ